MLNSTAFNAEERGAGLGRADVALARAKSQSRTSQVHERCLLRAPDSWQGHGPDMTGRMDDKDKAGQQVKGLPRANLIG